MTGLNCPVCGSGEAGDCVCPQPNVPASQGAREALMERLAEAMFRADCEGDQVLVDDVEWLWRDAGAQPIYRAKAEAVLPLVAAEVEAAVSVVRAERDDLDGLLEDPENDSRARRLYRDNEHLRAERDALREKVARLRSTLGTLVALKDGPRDDHYEQSKPVAWETARTLLYGESMFAALSDPTTPDQAGGEQESCCGKYDYETLARYCDGCDQ